MFVKVLSGLLFHVIEGEITGSCLLKVSQFYIIGSDYYLLGGVMSLGPNLIISLSKIMQKSPSCRNEAS